MTNIDIAPVGGYSLNQQAHGHVKMWKYDLKTGDKTLLLDNKNLIVNQGSDILASALSGMPNSHITHFYIGYTNVSSPSLGAISVEDKFNSFPADSANGYVRIPIAFSPSFLTEDGYDNNIPYFTTFLTSGAPVITSGLALSDGVKLTSLGLINARVPDSPANDRLFSKVNFGPIVWDSTAGLAISWGITFRTV